MSLSTKVTEILAHYRDICFSEGITSPQTTIRIDEQTSPIQLTLDIGFPAEHYQHVLQTALEQTFTQAGINVTVTLRSRIKAHSIQTGLRGLDNVKNCIAIASGKGGVGKSTTAINLALALQYEGAKVGLLDADIYGPNQPHMLGAKTRPESIDGKKMQPVIAHGLQTMSIGYLVDAKAPMVWRGPMVSGALQQLLQETAWQDLDYLIIDLPPGTGDVQLTLAQRIPVSAAVMITTPQEIALADVRKAMEMFQKVNIPILGVIENMSLHTCSHCGHVDAIFGQGGGQRLAEEYHLPLLGQLPLAAAIGIQADAGLPIFLSEPQAAASLAYLDIARSLSAKLAMRSGDLSRKFPRIEIRN